MVCIHPDPKSKLGKIFLKFWFSTSDTWDKEVEDPLPPTIRPLTTAGWQEELLDGPIQMTERISIIR